MIKIAPLLCCIFMYGMAYSQPFAKWSKTELTLNNGIVQRSIRLPQEKGEFVTTSYKPIKGAFRYFLPVSPDFQFEVNGAVYSGKSGWSLMNIKTIRDSREGDGAGVTLLSADNKIEVTVNFLMYPHLPVIRKSLSIKNLGTGDVSIESVDVESLAQPAILAAHSAGYTAITGGEK